MLKPETRLATILIADDTDSYRSLLKDLLEDEGYRIVCAEDGEEALSILQSQEVDLALLDVMIPRRTGFAACRAIKSDLKTLIPVVLVTGLDNIEDRIQGIECGADDFLNKACE